MNNSLVTYRNECNEVITIDAEPNGIHMDSVVDTARAAAIYASRLSNEYHHILHRHLAKADPHLASMFLSLIAELTTMTDATYENVRFRENENNKQA